MGGTNSSTSNRSSYESGNQTPNYSFYMNEIESQPKGAKIEVILSEWRDDFNKLEQHHKFGQWLFPLFEGNGANYAAFPLSKDEAREMRLNMEIGRRFVRSYKMMLRFFGMKLNEQTGEGIPFINHIFRPLKIALITSKQTPKIPPGTIWEFKFSFSQLSTNKWIFVANIAVK